MSLAAESPSPSPSSGSDDFAALLDAELDLASAVDSASACDPSTSPTSSDDEEDDEDVVADVETVEQSSAKRRKVKVQYQDREMTIRPDENFIGSFEDAQIKICPHPGFCKGLCYWCGERQGEEDVPGVPFGYVHEGLRLSTSEIDRLRESNLKNLLRERKLMLILDLDHTLINSTKLHDVSAAENNLGIQTAASKDDPNGSLFTLEGMQMLTKLRPFVRKFLKEASNMFEMCIYTMGNKAYAIEIAKLLDPRNVYFNSKVISNSDCTQRHQKGLDMVLVAESVAVILDDTEYIIKRVRQEVLQGCKLVFSRVFPSNSRPQDQFIWKMAEQLGAICSADVDSTITHVVAVDVGTDKARWAVKNNKIVVHPRWIEASNFRWHRQKEEDFPVKVKKNEKDKENDVAAATDPANENDKEDYIPAAATDPANE